MLGCCIGNTLDVTPLLGRIRGGEGRGGAFIHLKGEGPSSGIFSSRLRISPEHSIEKLEFGLSSNGDACQVVSWQRIRKQRRARGILRDDPWLPKCVFGRSL